MEVRNRQMVKFSAFRTMGTVGTGKHWDAFGSITDDHSKALSQWEGRDWEVLDCEVPHVIYEERIIEVPQAGQMTDPMGSPRLGT